MLASNKCLETDTSKAFESGSNSQVKMGPDMENVCNDDEQTNARKAKARLVVLGYQDPRLTEVNRDAPTLTREGRHTILQLIASQQWVLSSFDIKTAFLRGKADSENPLAMEPPKELRERMQLPDDQVCALIGNAYGKSRCTSSILQRAIQSTANLGLQNAST